MRAAGLLIPKRKQCPPTDGEVRPKRRRAGLNFLLGVSGPDRGGLGGGGCNGGGEGGVPWWRKQPIEVDPSSDSSSSTDRSWREADVKYKKHIEDLTLDRLKKERDKRKASRKPPQPKKPTVIAPPPAPPLGAGAAPSSGPIERAPPPNPRVQRGYQWGPNFVLAQVAPAGMASRWSVTCRLHSTEGKRCNKTCSFGAGMSEGEALHRIKHWCGLGLVVPDGPGARHTHMFEQGDIKEWPLHTLVSEAELDRIMEGEG